MPIRLSRQITKHLMPYLKKQKKSILLSLWLICAGLFPTHSLANDQLTGVKQEISRQQNSLKNQKSAFEKLQKALKAQELKINDIQSSLLNSKNELNSTNKQIDKLKLELSELHSAQAEKQKELAKLMNTYYLLKHRQQVSLNFLQQDPKSERLNYYYQYLANSRVVLIEELKLTEKKLNRISIGLAEEKNKVSQLIKVQNLQLTSLNTTQDERKKTLDNIKASIKNDNVYLAELKRNEARLSAEIARAKTFTSVPMDGIGRRKGKLPKPIEGKLLHQYGAIQTGSITWKGIVIKANYGQTVKAIYPGTVVFADYLRGYGLVVLLDHGKGDMSLYGFNQALLKKQGDKVAANEPIALAGDTGGQNQAALYFEIRRNSRPTNPLAWLQR